MYLYPVIFFLLGLLSLPHSAWSVPAGTEDLAWLNSYNPVWNSPSKNSSESMPCGGGDIGLNVWVENGDLLLYVARSGNFDENGSLLKNGRVRLTLSPNPFRDADSFRQELKLADGSVAIQGAIQGRQVKLRVWVDVHHPVVHIDLDSEQPLQARASFETWRFADRPLVDLEKSQCNSYNGYPGKVMVFHDEVAWSKKDGGIVFYHRNRNEGSVFNFILQQQKLGDDRGLWNPLRDLTFGGLMCGEGLSFGGEGEGSYADIPFHSHLLVTEKPVRNLALKIILHSGPAGSDSVWLDGLRRTVRTEEQAVDNSRQTQDWWRAFWNRSRIVIQPGKNDPSNVPWQVGRNYQLFRYTMGCNALGQFAQKFNGGIFTFDARWVNPKYSFSPDFRLWGGSVYTSQNQRLLCWPMLKSGDFELPVQEFERFLQSLPAAERRTRAYWGHAGASYTEQLEIFGLPAAAMWGFDESPNKGRVRPRDLEPGALTSHWVRYYYTSQLEFSLMVLDWYSYTGHDISRYLPFVESSIRFYEEHYQMRHRKASGQPFDARGKLVLAPSQAIEMYWDVINGTPDIAGLRTVLARLQTLPDSMLAPEKKKAYQALSARIPEIPVEELQGCQVIAPAAHYQGQQQNMEIPELYPVFPYGIYGVGLPGLELARSTWGHGVSQNQRSFNVCWSQVAIFAARLGLTEEARRLVQSKFSDAPRRFTAFWGPGPDYVPDVDHGGSAMVALQEMLLQTPGDKIILLPAWPRDWDVDFKLHAPRATTVSGSLRSGRIVDLHVSPAGRRADVVCDFPIDSGGVQK